MIRPVKTGVARRPLDESTVRRNGKRGTPTAAQAREELWSKFLRTRWKKHRNLLIEVYLPLVRSVAEQVAGRLPRSIDPEDLMSAGVFGLLQSVENFDPDRGTKFETFCRMRIRGAMLDELRSQDLLSRDARGRANRVSEASHRLFQQLGREPNSFELAEEVGLHVRDIDEILRKTATQTMISLDAAARDGSTLDDMASVSEDLVDADLEPLEVAQQKDLLLLIDQCLNEAERQIVTLRYRDGMTMRGIGRVLALSESRVCQLHSRLLNRLHRKLGADR